MTSRRTAVLVPLLVAAVVALVVVLRSGGLPDVPLAAGEPERPAGPVLLVPGYGGSTEALEPLAARLRAAGREAELVDLPGGAVGDLRAQARVLDAAVDEALVAGAPSVDVVGYSAGGVVARVWAEELGGADAARRVVTLGTPHQGTTLAGIARDVAPRQCPAACRQLAPGSALLTALGAPPEGPLWASVWSEGDGVVRPAASARLPGAVDLRLQGLCPGAEVSHGDLPRDPLSVGVVLRALTGDDLADAGDADCAALRAAGAPAGA